MFVISSLISEGALVDLGKVITIDLLLAGDNIVILAAVASSLPREHRGRVIRLGVAVSLVCLISLSFVATLLVKIIGVLLIGGMLLLWVAWKLFRELTHRDHAPEDIPEVAPATATPPAMSTRAMVAKVVLADLAMSVENVLAVAGAARNHPAVLFIGLALSVTLMAVAASALARVIERYRWLAFLGLAMILWVALGMIGEGWMQVRPLVGAMI